METVVAMIDKVVINANDEKTICDTKAAVKKLMEGFPSYPELG
jgi:glycine/serine hydroxymethyltransferase